MRGGPYPRIIDAHAHCGRRDRFPAQDLGDYLACLGDSGIGGAVMFAPVMEIYDRYDPDFRDTPQWRQRRTEANSYLLGIGSVGFEVFPYFFIWNDFAVEQLAAGHKGIKWHRHSDEPRYDYENPRCGAAIEEIRRRGMPVCLEEEFSNTLRFVDEYAPGVTVIIPHCGLLNGGYEALRRSGIFERPNVYADTALAPADAIEDYVSRYGHERILFGSDFPFGDPVRELQRILRLKLTGAQREAIVGRNVAHLLAESNRR